VSNAEDLCTFWGGEGAHFDFTNPDTINWWKDNVKSKLLDYGIIFYFIQLSDSLGIDCTWNDNNEWNVRSDDARCFGFGKEVTIKALRPIQTLLMVSSNC
jgi:alpha-glucosidase